MANNQKAADKAIAMATKPKHEVDAWLSELENQPEYITGYCIQDDGKYNGVYTFPNNKDKLEIHWPKNVVSEAPPEFIPAGMAAYWDNKKDSWELRIIPEEIGGVKPTKDETLAPTMTEEEILRMLPMPKGIPQKNEHGHYPYTVLNDTRTAWVWKYPEPSIVE